MYCVLLKMERERGGSQILPHQQNATKFRSNFFDGDQVNKNHPPQGQDDWVFESKFCNTVELICSSYGSRNDYVTHNVMDGGSQDESCDLYWVSEGINHLVRESMRCTLNYELIAAHDKNRMHQLFFGMEGSGKTRLLDQDFYLPRMFQNIDSKTPSYLRRNINIYQKGLGTEGVNFSVTDSSLQNRAHHIPSADASGRIRPEVDTSFCSPLWFLDSGASVFLKDSFNLLTGLHDIDCVSVANGQIILSNECRILYTPCTLWEIPRCTLWKSPPYSLWKIPLTVHCGKTATKNTRHQLWKSRHNKGRRMVSGRCLARKTRDEKWHDTSRKTRILVSRSDPISADNSSLLTPDSTPERAWRVASAAPQHMTGYLNHFTDYTAASGDQVIDTPTMGPMVFHGSGSVNTKNMTLRDVLYVPGLEANLVSTGQLAELGYTIAIGPYGCRVYKDDEGMDLVGKAHYVDGYPLELDFLRV